jgi:hypothetical protein
VEGYKNLLLIKINNQPVVNKFNSLLEAAKFLSPKFEVKTSIVHSWLHCEAFPSGYLLDLGDALELSEEEIDELFTVDNNDKKPKKSSL